jgi:hypothetical protein
MLSNSKFQKTIGELRRGSRTCGGRGRMVKDEERNGITPIIEIVEALGIVLRQDDKHFF